MAGALGASLCAAPAAAEEDGSGRSGRGWWAYQPLGGGGVPAVGSAPEGWGENPVDAFVLEALRDAGLEPGPRADRRTLVRRATYDLTGLPPSPSEVEAFVADPAPDGEAFAAVVDRLLASPHYGERWGRHWLDVVRFGESRGFERNEIIQTLWPFRDYVIASFNADKPFDHFIREHLAGDVLGAGDPDVEVASAFLVAGPYDDVGNQDAAQAAQIRGNTIDEIISATGQAFLGTTLGCARCHDHKFDPVTAADYYAFYATFAGVRHGERPLATSEAVLEREGKLAPLEARRAGLEKERAALEAAVLARATAEGEHLRAGWTRAPAERTGTEEEFAAVTARFVRLVCEAQDANPESASGFGIDEFEVWTAGEGSRNVALARAGAMVSGRAREIEDFPGAYSPQLAIDGEFGARFLATGSELVVELAEPARVGRVVFSSARGEPEPGQGKFTFVADYRIEVSDDGESWTEVAHGRDRKPVSPKHEDVRLRRAAEMTAAESAELAPIDRRLEEVRAAIAAVPGLPVVWVGTRSAEDAAGPFHVFKGGNPQVRGDPVRPTSLSALDGVVDGYALGPEAPEAERRRRLAEWVTAPGNPLTPRVLANRVWHYHFGTGIVDTPNDFGLMGGRPSHPALLDFLARQLQREGWRIKPLHRLIMLSQTYQQSSAWREGPGRADGDSRLLWRFPPRRLSAEEVRDTMLVVAGKLDRRRGGPGFRLYRYLQDNVATYVPLDEHGPETYRRAVYHHNARAARTDLLTEFDQPDCALPAPTRDETTTPLQALTLLNHSFTVDMAEALAARLEAEAGAGAESRVRRAFALAFQRAPDEGELGRAAAVVEEYGARAFCRALFNTSEMVYLD